MASYLKGAGTFQKRLDQAAKNIDTAIEAANLQGALIIQEEVVARVPSKTGKLRELFASQEAIQKSYKFQGGYVFGLVTPRLRGDGYYAKFVEYGTKGYYKGQFRFAGVDRRTGKLKLKKSKRPVPPRPAHPFFRPGCAAGRARIRALYEAAMRKAMQDA